jgi:arylsulfatase A-like enzyme
MTIQTRFVRIIVALTTAHLGKDRLMLIHLIVVLLSACSTQNSLSPSASPVSIQKLATIPAEITLPTQSHPEQFSVAERFTLPVKTTLAGAKYATLPFHAPPNSKRYKPASMSVSANGKALAFRSGNTKMNTWTVRGAHMALDLNEDIQEVEVHYPALSQALKRNSFGHAGLAAPQFVQRDLTLGLETQHGLFLPTPCTISWDVTLPPSAHFQATTAMMPAQFSAAHGDGAAFVLSVTTATEMVAVDTIKIASSTAKFSDWHVDLNAYSGQTVTLTITGDPLDNSLWDYVFIGSPKVTSKLPGQMPRHVIVVGLDTTRPDRFGAMGYALDTSPALDDHLKRFAIAENAWTPAPRTRPSFRSATTGRRPLEAVGATNIGEVFHQNQFATAGFVSNIHLHPRFDFDKGFDQWHLDATSKADDQVDMALKWLKQNENNDAYLFLHIMDPHLFYVAPKSYENKFVKERDPTLPRTFNRHTVYQWLRNGGVSEQRKAHIQGLYDAEIAYTSDQLARFLDEVDEMHTETLIVVHSDHGEELFEHGEFEHNHTLIDETTKAVLWTRAPHQQGGRFENPATLADIAPTLYDYAGFTDTPVSDGLSLRPLIDGTKADPIWNSRPIALGHLQYGHQRWGVVLNEHKYILHTRSGQESLFDLGSEEGEHKNIAKESDLTPYRKALAKVHDINVSTGLHIDFSLKGSEPVTIRLPVVASEVSLLPYDAVTEHPVNQAWGQQPPYTTSDIAAVELSADNHFITITPGKHGVGTIAVSTDTTPVASFSVTKGTETSEANSRKMGKRATWHDQPYRVTLRIGTVVHPPANEFTRINEMRNSGPTQAATVSEIDLLKSLGYIAEDPE